MFLHVRIEVDPKFVWSASETLFITAQSLFRNLLILLGYYSVWRSRRYQYHCQVSCPRFLSRCMKPAEEHLFTFELTDSILIVSTISGILHLTCSLKYRIFSVCWVYGGVYGKFLNRQSASSMTNFYIPSTLTWRTRGFHLRRVQSSDPFLLFSETDWYLLSCMAKLSSADSIQHLCHVPWPDLIPQGDGLCWNNSWGAEFNSHYRMLIEHWGQADWNPLIFTSKRTMTNWVKCQ